MPDDPRIRELVQEVLDSNRLPEDVCADCPELLWEVQKRWKRVCRVDSQLEALFPSSESSSHAAIDKRRFLVDGQLPTIPGYEVDAVLGRGGMGVVYKARHVKLNRPVALKMMLYGAVATSSEQTRFQREAEAVAALHDPHIVQIYDVGEADGRPYYTMEFLEGGSLARKLAGKPQPAAAAALYSLTLAEAVQAAHDAGIVHRDLKPANVLLTSDGTLKIGDFGLARRSDAEQSLTLTAARVGTPSYMAPEQAVGKPSASSPAVDIYALGAMLYEMLTGRPPFRAETVAETQRQVIAEDPAPPSRLNVTVPRDLETICLKCLSKDPARRYATAAALAKDLQLFLRGEPISARRPGAWERLGKWVKRRPAVAALIASSVLFTAILTSGLVWLAVEQANRRQAVEADLRDMTQLEQQALWANAGVALQRAKARIEADGADELRKRVEQAGRDLQLVKELDTIRLNRLTTGNGPYYKALADRRYAEAFSKASLGDEHDVAVVVARRINASAVRVALLAALDDWAVRTPDKSRRTWLLSIAREADKNPAGWGDRIRNPDKWDDDAELANLAGSVPTKAESVSLLLALGERLKANRGTAITFVMRVQKDHPADFWANMALGEMLLSSSPVEAGGFFRAALASRPQFPVAYSAVGDALRLQGRQNEALGYYQQALDIDANYARAYTGLGNLLNDTHKTNDAIKSYQKALEADPNYYWAHFHLANTLRNVGRFNEALEHYKQFYAIDKSNATVANFIRADLVRHGRGEEVLRGWKQALELNPPEHEAWFGYAELCLFLGREDDYRRARQDLIRHFGNTDDPSVAEQTSRAILLASAADDELQVAVRLAELTAASKPPAPQEWVYPYRLFAKGLADYRRGDFDSAISIMSSKAAKVMGPCPRLVIAMAKYRQGKEGEARKTLAGVIGSVDWRTTEAPSHDQWIWHIMRREAEATISPGKTAVSDAKAVKHEEQTGAK